MLGEKQTYLTVWSIINIHYYFSDPFNTNVYHIEKPKGIALEYGSPSFTYAQKLKSLQEKAGNGKVEITLSAKAYNDGRYIAKKEWHG